MTKYNVGYINKSWCNDDFVIMGMSYSKNAAKMLMDAYNAA